MLGRNALAAAAQSAQCQVNRYCQDLITWMPFSIMHIQNCSIVSYQHHFHYYWRGYLYLKAKYVTFSKPTFSNSVSVYPFRSQITGFTDYNHLHNSCDICLGTEISCSFFSWGEKVFKNDSPKPWAQREKRISLWVLPIMATNEYNNFLYKRMENSYTFYLCSLSLMWEAHLRYSSFSSTFLPLPPPLHSHTLSTYLA